MQSLQRKVNADTAEIEGEEAPKGGLQRKVNNDTAEIEGKEVQKAFVRECRTYSEKSTLIHRKISGEAEK